MSAEVLLKAAQKAYLDNQYALAVDLAQLALKHSPTQVSAWRILATAHCAMGKQAEAKSASRHLPAAQRAIVKRLCLARNVILE